MIHGLMYELSIYMELSIHMTFITYGMALTCSGASHCIMHSNIAYHGCECMVENQRCVWRLMSGLGTVRRSLTELDGCMKRKENLCRVIERRARFSFE